MAQTVFIIVFHFHLALGPGDPGDDMLVVNNINWAYRSADACDAATAELNRDFGRPIFECRPFTLR